MTASSTGRRNDQRPRDVEMTMAAVEVCDSIAAADAGDSTHHRHRRQTATAGVMHVLSVVRVVGEGGSLERVATIGLMNKSTNEADEAEEVAVPDRCFPVGRYPCCRSMYARTYHRPSSCYHCCTNAPDAVDSMSKPRHPR